MALIQSDIIIADGSTLNIESGETMNNIIVNSGCSLFIYSGGIATNIKENGGYVKVADGAEASFTPNTFSGGYSPISSSSICYASFRHDSEQHHGLLLP